MLFHRFLPTSLAVRRLFFVDDSKSYFSALSCSLSFYLVSRYVWWLWIHVSRGVLPLLLVVWQHASLGLVVMLKWLIHTSTTWKLAVHGIWGDGISGIVRVTRRWNHSFMVVCHLRGWPLKISVLVNQIPRMTSVWPQIWIFGVKQRFICKHVALRLLAS